MIIRACLLLSRSSLNKIWERRPSSGRVRRHVLIGGGILVLPFGSRGRCDSTRPRILERCHPRVRTTSFHCRFAQFVLFFPGCARGFRSGILTKRHPRDEYIRTILSPNSWGGAIELTILAAHYGTEITSIDVESGRIDRFGANDDGASASRVLLIYSGIHYDAAVLAPAPDAPPDFCASVVPAGAAEGERVLEALRALAAKLRAKRAYTNTATFDLKCEVRVSFLVVHVERC